jgi:hypothetical protein
MGNTPLTQDHLHIIAEIKQNCEKAKELCDTFRDWKRYNTAFKNSKHGFFRCNNRIIYNAEDMIMNMYLCLQSGLSSMEKLLVANKIYEHEECALHRYLLTSHEMLTCLTEFEKFIDENAPIIIEGGECTSSEANAPIETNNEGQ